eukprot:766379-Hanusia_phi.AAC.2
MAPEHQSEMSSCIRYCTVSIRAIPSPCSSRTRWNSVLPSPLAAASLLMMVGASWQSSPARTSLLLRRMGIQQETSSAMAASSMTQRSKASRELRTGSEAPVLVQRTTWAPRMI